MNKIFLIGNLTRDPEVGTTANAISYCKFSIAVNRRFSKEQNEVDFFNIVCWRGLAETCGKNLMKGKKVAICGSIQIRAYDGNDGTKKQSVDVTADEVEFLSSPGGRDDSQVGSQRKSEDITQLSAVEDISLPF